MSWITLVRLLFILGPFILLAIIASPNLSLHDDGWIFTKPRKMKKSAGALIHKDVNSH
jgi:hypothetical protein